MTKGMGMTRRYALTDAQRERVGDLLPDRAGRVSCPASNSRLFVIVVFYSYWARISWRV